MFGGRNVLTAQDPYHFHPELRGRIKPAAESFFRDVDVAEIDAHVTSAGFPADWRTPCEERDADRRRWLDGRWDRDLWVFAYGSLMWDPSIEFTEVRQASCTGYQRSFCLWDNGGRGSVEEPGLMLALDVDGRCDGLAFRVAQKDIEHETFVLFRREMLLPVYRPEWLALETAAGPIEALGFVANRDHDDIKPGLPLAQQASMIAGAKGMFGENFDYLSDLRAQLDLLGLEDPYISELHAATEALRG